MWGPARVRSCNATLDTEEALRACKEYFVSRNRHLARSTYFTPVGRRYVGTGLSRLACYLTFTFCGILPDF